MASRGQNHTEFHVDFPYLPVQLNVEKLASIWPAEDMSWVLIMDKEMNQSLAFFTSLIIVTCVVVSFFLFVCLSYRK
jgi:hypothetical protein